jgi:mRNA-degrading endonuclease RelE of RelBE toxin-antitoxin system
MADRLSVTEEADSHLRSLTARDRRIVQSAILSHLRDQPITPARAVKRLRPNPFAEWELRAGDYRVLYNAEGDEVVILLVGRKVGNKLLV